MYSGWIYFSQICDEQPSISEILQSTKTKSNNSEPMTEMCIGNKSLSFFQVLRIVLLRFICSANQNQKFLSKDDCAPTWSSYVAILREQKLASDSAAL